MNDELLQRGNQLVRPGRRNAQQRVEDINWVLGWLLDHPDQVPEFKQALGVIAALHSS